MAISGRLRNVTIEQDTINSQQISQVSAFL